MDGQKIGRNEPCPCGSGKKYRKCCGEHNPDVLNRKNLIRENVFAAIEAQMRDSDPPETKQTFDRLIAEGCIEAEAMDLIGVVFTAEIFRVLKTQTPFDRGQYVAALNKLPTLPWENKSE